MNSDDVPSGSNNDGVFDAVEWMSTDMESVLLELQTQLEKNNLIAKPMFQPFIPCSIMMSKIKLIQDEVEGALKRNETNFVLSLRNHNEPLPSTSNEISKLRDIYYQNVRLFKTQRSVDRMVEKICRLLNTPQWNLGIHTTSKGLVYGPVQITLRSGEILDCSLQQGGTLIPQDLPHGASYESSAKFGLVVEKDTAFQSILSSGLGYPLNCCIMITGKGYPDMNTRFLVKDLSAKLSIPMFALVDGDPHGIDIFFNYKYGSMAKAFINEQLSAFHIMWLGIHPTDMIDFKPSILQPLTTADLNKMRSLLERNYVKNDEKLREQIESLATQGRKCEIENVTSISNRFLSDVYLPSKILMKKFI